MEGSLTLSLLLYLSKLICNHICFKRERFILLRMHGKSPGNSNPTIKSPLGQGCYSEFWAQGMQLDPQTAAVGQAEPFRTETGRHRPLSLFCLGVAWGTRVPHPPPLQRPCTTQTFSSQVWPFAEKQGRATHCFLNSFFPKEDSGADCAFWSLWRLQRSAWACRARRGWR